MWSQRTGRVVGGHQRINVAKHIGYTELDNRIWQSQPLDVKVIENPEEALVDLREKRCDEKEPHISVRGHENMILMVAAALEGNPCLNMMKNSSMHVEPLIVICRQAQ